MGGLFEPPTRRMSRKCGNYDAAAPGQPTISLAKPAADASRTRGRSSSGQARAYYGPVQPNATGG